LTEDITIATNFHGKANRSKCRGCGKTILWIETDEGKKVPLDPSPPVYVVKSTKHGNAYGYRFRLAMVSHFATCPNANEFSASGRDGEETS